MLVRNNYLSEEVKSFYVSHAKSWRIQMENQTRPELKENSLTFSSRKKVSDEMKYHTKH